MDRLFYIVMLSLVIMLWDLVYKSENPDDNKECCVQNQLKLGQIFNVVIEQQFLLWKSLVRVIPCIWTTDIVSPNSDLDMFVFITILWSKKIFE